MVQHPGCRLSPVQISSLSLHTLVFSTLGLNVKWGVCMCVWLSCKCVCVCACLSSWLLCGSGFRVPWKEPITGQAVAAKQAKG